MGLAGVILVVGITPFAVQAMGAAAIPCLIGIQVIGLVVCLCMGELAALWPHRTGGTPSYAYEGFRPLGETTARHIGGVAGWSYWLGWFPVAPINMILAASYIAVLFHVPLGKTVDPLGALGTPEGIGVLIITLVGLVVLFIPCYLGIRLGTGFATLLGIVSMVPLTLLIILPVFKPSTFHWSNVSGFHFADPKTATFVFVFGWLFVISWNGIGVESAACYVAECRDPRRDAKIAMTAEGIYGLFIYAGTAIVFVAVLGASLKSSDPLTEYTNFADQIFGHGGWVKYLIGIPLICALLLTVSERHHGCGPVAVPGIGRPAHTQVLRPQEQAPRSGSRHALQPGLRPDGRPVRVASAHLHLLQRGLPPRHRRLRFRVLLRPPVPQGPGQPVPPARHLPLDRLGHGALPHLRLLRGRVGIAEHRQSARVKVTLLFILGFVVVLCYVPLHLWRG